LLNKECPMGKNTFVSSTQTSLRSAGKQRRTDEDIESPPLPVDAPRAQTRWLFRALWFAVTGLLILAVFFAAYATVWEYSTRRYLQGFSDAIVPATAPGDEKIEAILNWMAHGPARYPSIPSGLMPDRDPTDTLNYYALLQVCGTATNAFINLMDAGHMRVRRLLLLDKHDRTNHVVAEALVDGRWIIVDPAFRVVLRSADGRTVTREQLSDPATFTEATNSIPQYDPQYTYDHTAHIRIARLGYLGTPIQRILDRLIPGWESSTIMTVLVERESYAAMISSILLLVLLLLARISLLWYGRTRLGIRPFRIRETLSRTYTRLVSTCR
jgi:hypothetical protein